MATKPFPTGSDRFVAVYDPADPFRIITWQHSHRVPVRAATVPSSDEDYTALAAVAVQPYTENRAPGLCRTERAEIGGLDRCGFWLGGINRLANLATVPPVIRFQIRAALACSGSAGGLSEVVFEKNIVLADWQDGGLIVQVDDVLCQQWEIWAFIDSTTNAGASEVELDLNLIASRGASAPSVRQGRIVP